MSLLQKKENIKLIALEKEKDFTDLEVAIDFTINKYQNLQIEIFADGKRLEHFISQINIIKKNKINIILFTEYSKIFKLSAGNNYIKFSDIYKYISFYTEETNIISIQDLKYTTHNTTIDKHDNLCISNEFIGYNIDGKIQNSEDLLVFLTKDDS